jgi:hypothetical protein
MQAFVTTLLPQSIINGPQDEWMAATLPNTRRVRY